MSVVQRRTAPRARTLRRLRLVLALAIVAVLGMPATTAPAAPMLEQPAAVSGARAPAVSITTTSPLPRGKIGVAYSKTLAATGGGPYTWKLTLGTLPAGLSLSTAGVISGTPTAGGSKTFTIKVTGAGGASASKQFTLVVDTVWVVTTSLPGGSVGTAYNATLTAGGTGPFTWSIVVGSGTLPAGLSLAATTGVISGTPTVAGKKSFKVKVVGAGGKSATKLLSITIATAGTVTITTTSLPSGTTGTAYAATLTASGAGPFTWSIASGSLPAGLALDASTGAISGTPTAAGTSSFTAKVVGAGGASATKPLSIVISSPSISITTASLPDGQVALSYAATLTASGTGPFTWSIASGSLPAGLSLNATTGAISGTPTAAGTAAFTVRVAGAGGSSATKPLSITVLPAASAEDWAQHQHDAGHSGWSPNETIINARNVAGVHAEWDTPEGPAVIAGDRLYATGPLPSNPDATALMTYDLTSGTVLSHVMLDPNEGCGGPTELLASSDKLVINCGSNVIAYTRAAPHTAVWKTAETDPGSYVSSMSLAGTTLVTRDSDKVTAYRMSDGQRLWQQLVPSGAGNVSDAVVSGSTVVVGYDDRLRGLSLSTGAQLWVTSGVAAGKLLAGSDGWIYTDDNDGVSRYNAATGAAGWAVRPASDIYSLAGVDGDTIYAWEATYFYGTVATSRLLALRTSDGSLKWAYDMSERLASFAVTGGLIWLNTTFIYSEGRYSHLIALNRATGAELLSQPFEDNMYAWGQLAVGNGHIAFAMGGSSGSPIPHRLRVYGLAPQVPLIDTRVLPLARPGVAYAASLAASRGQAPYSWSVTSGSLPAGVTLSASGALSGTPSAAGTATFTVKATDARGASRSQRLVLGVVAVGTASWSSPRGGPEGNGFEPAETAIGLSSAASLAYRYSLAKPATTPDWLTSADQPLVVGNRVYAVRTDGALAAWDTAGTGTTRPPLWTRAADPSDSTVTFTSAPSHASGVLVATTNTAVVGVRASDGVILWTTTMVDATPIGTPIADGSRGYVMGYDNAVRAYSLSTGALLWTGATLPDRLEGLATDGTRVFAKADCTVAAFTATTGATAWTTQLTPRSGLSCGDGHEPVVDSGVLLTQSWGSASALRATDGAELWWVPNGRPSYSAVAGGVWIKADMPAFTSPIKAYDLQTGDLLWSNSTTADDTEQYVSIAGDLVVVLAKERYVSYLRGYDRTTGELVWNGGQVASYPAWTIGGATIAGGQIYVSTSDAGIRVYGPPTPGRHARKSNAL